MHLEFLGTAGYHPSETRHTSCVFLPDVAPDAAFVLDAGSGFFRLTTRPLPARTHIFLSHPHLDHVMGLTFLLDILYRSPSQITIYGDANTLRGVRSTLFGSALFPLELAWQTVEVRTGEKIVVEGVEVSTHPLTHPGGSRAYRFEWLEGETKGKTLCYVTDTAGDASYHDFISGEPDLLIHERNFPDAFDELALASGHCTSAHLVAAAQVSGAKQVVATHFNPLTATDPLAEDDLYDKIPGLVGAADCLKLEF